MAQTSAHSRESMRKAGDALQKAEDDLRRTRSQLNSEQQSLATRWQGEGSQAFVKVFQQFDEQFVRVLTDLNMIQQKIGDARVKYDANEAETTARVNRLSGLINS
ncbi:WXG100 family type VII secretion target [Actinomadura xylanilytica]|uniref:WXG100 family type VII secretion target n=1 Tax=Actinomadura xylanilytica TaxID=887459 RepID=UPI00255A9C34|nr:WXG100 family type VII secretion target [Actinomadura xylanilytica]MDL4772608.1 WXG100 family type VII secretion target [Actinomadura xylanilytica]